MARVEKSIEIKAPPEKVWEMLAFDRLLEWEVGYKGELKSVEYTSEVHTPEDKLRVGASAHEIRKKGGEFDFEVTESLENERITYRLRWRGGMRALVTSILEPVDEGIKFTYVVDYDMPWGIFGKILGRLFHGRAARESERSLENLKSILEK